MCAHSTQFCEKLKSCLSLTLNNTAADQLLYLMQKGICAISIRTNIATTRTKNGNVELMSRAAILVIVDKSRDFDRTVH